MSIKEEDLEYIYSHLTDAERKKFQNSTVLVTGCAGFIGYYLMNFLAAYKDALGIRKVIGLDNFMLKRPGWIDTLAQKDGIDIRKFDIISDDISSIPGSGEADLIIHMASIASPMFYREHPIETLDANIWGLRRLLDFYCEKEIRGFLFFSSSETYGNPDAAHIPTDESYHGDVAFTGPRSCYDESKRFGETMCMLFAQKYGLPIGVVRPFNNYGPGMSINDKRVPADFAKNIFENRDIVILSDGSPTRTFCYIADAVTGYLKILLHGSYDYFNIGIDKPEISIRRLAEIYVEAGKEMFGYTGEVIFGKSEDQEYLTNNPERRCPVIDKARNVLGYNPSIYVEDGVRRFLTYLKETDRREFE